MYLINPHLEGRTEAIWPDDYPMLTEKDKSLVKRLENGDVAIYTTSGCSADVLHDINVFLINEARGKNS